MFGRTDIEKYFVAEKNESLLFFIVGLLAIAMAIFFYTYLKTNFYKGAAIPLLFVGLIQAVAGHTVHARSDKQRIDNVYAYDMDPGKLKNSELPRMRTVEQNFVIYRWIEIVLLLAGLALILLYRLNPGKTFWFGLGISLSIQAALLLLADHYAEKRAGRYANGLETFAVKKST